MWKGRRSIENIIKTFNVYFLICKFSIFTACHYLNLCFLLTIHQVTQSVFLSSNYIPQFESKKSESIILLYFLLLVFLLFFSFSCSYPRSLNPTFPLPLLPPAPPPPSPPPVVRRKIPRVELSIFPSLGLKFPSLSCPKNR